MINGDKDWDLTSMASRKKEVDSTYDLEAENAALKAQLESALGTLQEMPRIITETVAAKVKAQGTFDEGVEAAAQWMDDQSSPHCTFDNTSASIRALKRTAQPDRICGFQTYSGDGNFEVCELPIGHDDGAHEYPKKRRGINDGPDNSIIQYGAQPDMETSRTTNRNRERAIAMSNQQCICEGEFPAYCGPECDCFHHEEVSDPLADIRPAADASQMQWKIFAFELEERLQKAISEAEAK